MVSDLGTPIGINMIGNKPSRSKVKYPAILGSPSQATTVVLPAGSQENFALPTSGKLYIIPWKRYGKELCCEVEGKREVEVLSLLVSDGLSWGLVGLVSEGVLIDFVGLSRFLFFWYGSIKIDLLCLIVEVGQKKRQTRGTNITIAEDCGGTCMDSLLRPCKDTQANGSMSKDTRGSTCMDAFGSMFTDFSTDITGVRGSTCPYILTKGTGTHGVTSK